MSKLTVISLFFLKQMERILNKASKTHKLRVEVSHARPGIAAFSQSCRFRLVKQHIYSILFMIFVDQRISKW